MDPLTLLAGLASAVSFLTAAFEALRTRKRPKRAPERRQGPWGHIEEWGRNNPVRLGLGLGCIFLVAAVALARITEPSSRSEREANIGSPSPTIHSNPQESEKPADEPAAKPMRVPCLPSRTSATDNSMGTARGPLESMTPYTGTITGGDEDWLGYCIKRDGPVTITFENACPSSKGPNDIYAYFLDPGGEENQYLHPKPGQFETETIEVSAGRPHFVHIFDLEESDIGGDICSRLPWTLTVIGDLSPVLATNVN